LYMLQQMPIVGRIVVLLRCMPYAVA